jgi:predicted alpha/beta superfamily hydrolase
MNRLSGKVNRGTETMASRVQASLSNTECFTLTSSCASEEYCIFVGLPPGYALSNKTYPALYILDGNLEFPLVKSVCEVLWLGGEIPEAVLVGIGYPVTDLNETVPLRTRDLTPTVKGPGTGGAEKFLRFIQRELIPLVDLNYRADPNLRALFGDSRGGLFALYALFTAPGLFHRFLIVSPSIWWDQEAIYEYEERFAAQHSDLPARIFLSAGSRENEQMIANVLKLTSLLCARNYPNLTLDVNILEGETHYSVIPAAASRGLRSTLGAISRP